MPRRTSTWLAALPALLLLMSAPAARADPWTGCTQKPLPAGTPVELGLDYSLKGDLDALLRDAVATGQTHSAAAVVLRRGKVFYRGSAGGARPDSIFDVASLTKVAATVPAALQLVDEGKLDLDRPASRHLPLLAGRDKQQITPRQLLMHTSGLHSVVWAGKLTDTRAMILARIKKSRMRARPGQRFKYSDIGFIALGELASRMRRAPLQRLVHDRLYVPLGMCDTGFAPPAHIRPRVISPWPGGGKAGQVYDPMGARMAGVAGHAGLFSTADDLARLGQMLLDGGQLQGQRVLSRKMVARMIRRRQVPGRAARRALGWDVSSPGGATTSSMSPAAYGHTGFTGTSLWIDPRRKLVVVLLTNRTHVTPTPSVTRLRARLHQLVWNAASQPPKRPVRSGLDNLAAGGFKLLAGRKVGLITNHSATDHRGRWIVDLLAGARVEIKSIFVPEHGLKGKVDRHIKDSRLRRGGQSIPVYSLFGHRRRPTAETLSQIDTLVFDVAAVGVRYYTYLSTMGWAMEEAARHKLSFVVLDRPNPIGGAVVQGPLAISGKRSSTNYHPLPIRYGMTMGELARMYNRERHIGAKLRVVRLTGWRRELLFNQLGLPWVDPSPNIRSWRQALLYAGVGFMEGTNLAVGRGTDAPFQLLGAPWVDGKALARALNRARPPGVYAVPTSFTPTSSRHRGKRCEGVRLLLTDPRRVNPAAVGVTLARAIWNLHSDRWKIDRMSRMIRHPPTGRAIRSGEPVDRILPLWVPGLLRFRQMRRRYLLY